jgi:hypothetical protein
VCGCVLRRGLHERGMLWWWRERSRLRIIRPPKGRPGWYRRGSAGGPELRISPSRGELCCTAGSQRTLDASHCASSRPKSNTARPTPARRCALRAPVALGLGLGGEMRGGRACRVVHPVCLSAMPSGAARCSRAGQGSPHLWSLALRLARHAVEARAAEAALRLRRAAAASCLGCCLRLPLLAARCTLRAARPRVRRRPFRAPPAGRPQPLPLVEEPRATHGSRMRLRAAISSMLADTLAAKVTLTHVASSNTGRASERGARAGGRVAAAASGGASQRDISRRRAATLGGRLGAPFMVQNLLSRYEH